MSESLKIFVDSVVETLRPSGPVYHLGFCDGQSDASAWLEACFPRPAIIGYRHAEQGEPDELPFSDAVAKTVVCTGVWERVSSRQWLIDEMLRILSPGGMLLLGAACDESARHGRWRLTPRAVQRLLSPLDTTLVGWQGTEDSPRAIFGLGLKPPVAPEVLGVLGQLPDRIQARLTDAAARQPWTAKCRDTLSAWTAGGNARRRHRQRYQAEFTIHLSLDGKQTETWLQSCLPDENLGGRLDVIK